MTPSIESTLIVGGGLAGIAAAIKLAECGVRVTLCESRQRLGGRTGSFAIRDSSGVEIETLDYCQHVGMGCCNNLKELIALLGQEHEWHAHRQLHFFGPQGDYQLLNAWPLLPAPLHLTGWLLKWPQLTIRDRLSVARGLLAIRKLPLDHQTASQSALAWLQAKGQTPPAIEHFWSTIIVSALGEELARVSLAGVAKVLQDGFLNRRDSFHLLVPQRPLGELFGTLATERLQRLGVQICVGAAVNSLKQLPSGRMRVTMAQGSHEADAVIVAVPWHQLSRIEFVENIGGLQDIAASASQLQSSSITGVHTWWDRAWLDVPHAAIVGRLAQWVFPKPNSELRDPNGATNHLPKGLKNVYYQIVISGSRSLRGIEASQLASIIHDDLAHVFPAVRDSRLLACKPVTDPQAVFSMTPESHQFRPAIAVGPRVALAGDWTQTGWPATMEGAILSGFAAAEHVSR